MTDYSQDVIDGKIVACKKHRWACLRFLNDLKRDDWEWTFVEEQAERYMRWMRLFRHRKGALAGQRKEPCDYEKFVYGNLYGWWSKDKTIRRFRTSYEQLARKQAKSQDKAIQALYEISAFGEPAAEAYIAATKKAQCAYVYSEAEWLFNNSTDPAMKQKFVCKHDDEKQQKTIKHVKSGSTFSRLSKDDKKTGDGSNPHFVVLDEYHLHETTEYYDVLQSGFGSRKNPLLSIITTAGFDLNNPCYRVEYDLVSRILNPNDPTTDDRYFAIVCELDRNDGNDVIVVDGRVIEPGGIIDELGSDDSIRKTNPVTWDSPEAKANIMESVNKAKNSEDKYRDLITKIFNVWIQSRPSGYMDMTRWDAVKVSPDTLQEMIKDKAKGRCYVGFDLSAKIDLTAVSFVFPWIEEGCKTTSYAVITKAYLPRSMFAEKIHVDKVPYDVWEKHGHLAVTDGAVIDYNYVLKDISDTIIANGWDVIEYCLDPWGASSIATELQNEGKTVVEIRQGLKTLGEPTKGFREAVYAERLFHDGNPLLSWAVGNCVTRGDHNDNIMLDKQKARQRIDPVAASITAFTRAMTFDPNAKKKETVNWGVTFI
jgi:phage terminase large subunit-like protein